MRSKPPAIRIQSNILKVGLALGLIASARAQWTNPLPSLADSGLEIAIEEWLAIPASAPDGTRARINHLKPCPDSSRLFCNDLRGKLWVIANEQATATTLFVDLAAHFPRFIDSPGLGTGFGSFAFHPEFVSAAAPGYGKFYTGHVETPVGSPAADFEGPVSVTGDQHGVITEWTMTNPSDNAITTGTANFTKRELLRVEFPWIVHGLQELAFDPNAVPGDDNYGCLFVCVGDGGSVAVSAPGNPGRIDSILGTIVRFLPVLSTGQSAGDYTTSANGGYLIPKSNPFASAADPTPGDGFDSVGEIFAYGFRNPHRISWDSAGTEKMICGVIGEDNIEEIELVEAGGHYGWPDREGSYRFDPSDPEFVYPLPSPDTAPPGSPPAPASYRYPAAQYDHDEGIAVVGGYVYRGKRIPELWGRYLCGDLVLGKLFAVPEADLILQAPATSGDAPGILGKVGLRSMGAPATFLEIVGASRADLRFGIDHAGELYLLSKQNGTIYRVKSKAHDFVSELGITAPTGGVTLSFPTETGMGYRLWSSSELQFWEFIDTAITGDGNPAQWVDSSPDGRSFYKVEAIPVGP